MRFRLTAALAAYALLLTGCLIPEKFSAKVDFQPDGSYSFSYKGSAVHAMAAMQIAKTGPLNAKIDGDLERETAKLKNNPLVQQASYKGNGRYDLVLASQRKAGEALDIMKVMAVKTGKDGIITISSVELDPRGKQQLAALSIKLDGQLEVKLPKNAEVLSHNATGTPSFFGGSYSWKINGMEQRPMMKIRIK